MSNIIKSTLLAAATALTLAASGAHATTSGTEFDFYSNGGSLLGANSSSLTFTSNGIGVTITPVSTESGAKVNYRWDGIGVSTGFLEPGELDSSLLHSPGDALLLSFSQAVSLSSVAFSLWEGNSSISLDKVSITTGGQTYTLSNALNVGGIAVDTFNTASLIPAGQYFVIQAQGDTSSFRLAGLTVSAVPEAGTVVMFGLGLVGVALAARRRQA
ncbi:MAG TPA: PEP-CTERM sorting domain-containing protein [Candidatus Aquabacterium excrementipullorum]|nr:PEP-CTERM sorting domain-containing protein [Candidatus Aquabacterium excrementipullorum]